MTSICFGGRVQGGPFSFGLPLPPLMTHFALSLLFTLSLVGSLAGCSGDDDDDDASESATVTPLPLLSLNAVSLPPGQERAAYSARFTASGGTPPYRFETLSGALPYGLQLEQDSGALAGTPSYAGSYSFEIRVKDATGQTASRAFSVSITPWNTAASLACGGSATFNLTGSAWTDAQGGYQFQSPASSAFFSLALPPSDTTVVTLTATSAAGDPTIFVGRPGQPVSSDLVAYYYLRAITDGDEELRIDAATSPKLSDYQSYGAAISVVVAATTPGEMTLSVTCATGTVLATPFLPNAVVGQAYQAKLQAVSGTPPYTFTAVEGLPAGLTLSPDGLVSGQVQTSGVYPVKVQVADTAATGETRTLALWAPEVSPLACGDSVTADFDTYAFDGQQGLATVGGAVFYALSVAEGTSQVQLEVSHTGEWTVGLFEGAPGSGAGGSSDEDYVHAVFDSPADDPDPVHWTIDTIDLPMLQDFQGVIPLALASQDGYGQATLKATCSSPLAIETAFLPNGAVGTPYLASLEAVGGTGPYTWSVDRLPDGVGLDTSGGLAGLPITAGPIDSSLTVTDKQGASVSRTIHYSIGALGKPSVCGQTTPITCDDYVSSTLTADAWEDRVQVDFTTPGGVAFYCLRFPEESSSLSLSLSNNSGDADLFLGYPGMAPGDVQVEDYWYFSSLDGNDAITVNDSRYPPLAAYGGLMGVAIPAYVPGQFVLNVVCE